MFKFFTHCCHYLYSVCHLSLSTPPGAQTSSSSPSTAATISPIGDSASAELFESTAHIQVSYTYTERKTQYVIP